MNVIQILVVFTVESFAVGVEPQNLYVFGDFAVGSFESILRLTIFKRYFQSFLDFCYK